MSLTGCATPPTPQQRLALADKLAQSHRWHRQAIAAGDFVLTSYLPQRFAVADLLTVYIEGDGFAWRNRSTPSTDPTPINPLALKLALAQPQGARAYLARPCQFIDHKASDLCAQRYWTQQRFAPAVIAATDVALDQLKRQAGAKQLQLVGYSGGAAVAMLVAAGRKDVVRIVTVAGNLDTTAWTDWHGITPLTGSRNPADIKQQLEAIEQHHWLGERDVIVPPAIAYAYAKDSTLTPDALRLFPAFNHRCCWVEQWPALWNTLPELTH